MTLLHTWATRWQIPPAAMRELTAALGAHSGPLPTPAPEMSEAGVQARVRLAASQAGMRVWRNNVGAVHDPIKNIHVRFGLANDSPQMNDVLKSADLVGVKKRLIGPSDVGTFIGQFVSLEVKHAGWKWAGDAHEQAQANWALLINSLGGDARFVSDPSHV